MDFAKLCDVPSNSITRCLRWIYPANEQNHRMPKASGISLQTLATSCILTLSLTLSWVFIGHSYHGLRTQLIATAEADALQLAARLNTQIKHATQSALNNLRLLELDSLVHTTTSRQRQQRLPMLARILQLNPLLESIYAGYPDGGFISLHRLDTPQQWHTLKAPKKARFLMHLADRRPLGCQEPARWLFYDLQLQLLESRDKPNCRFDPRLRPWFRQAQATNSHILTSPYTSHIHRRPCISVALRNPETGTVLGASVSLQNLSQLMRSAHTSPAYVALINDQGQIIADTGAQQPFWQDSANPEPSTPPILTQLAKEEGNGHLNAYQTSQGTWYGLKVEPPSKQLQHWNLLFAISERQLLAKAEQQRTGQLEWMALLLALLLPLGWLSGRVISRPLRQLASEVDALSQFDFKCPPQITSRIREINQLACLLTNMADTIRHFQAISLTLAQEPNHDRMLCKVTEHLIALTGAQAGTVYLYHADSQTLSCATSTSKEDAPLLKVTDGQVDTLIQAVRNVFVHQGEQAFITPLLGSAQQPLGILVLQVEKGTAPHLSAFRQFVDEVSGAAATAIETQSQVKTQNALLEGIIHLLANAIDTKSPHTSGHCQRVLQLADMLIDAIETTHCGPLGEFQMDDQERREFRIAAWLHDCGKITTPEHIVDKATKLETVHNRIHEIRTRFEVLWRDTEVDYWKGLAQGLSETPLRISRDQKQQQLQQNFAFIADLNLGREFVSDDDLERLHHISQQHWWRHFDKRLGLSQEEQQRLPEHSESLPVSEALLADQPEHCIPWDKRRPAVEKGHPDNHWGFDMQLPACAQHLGELHNLSIRRGTLTPEERFTINNHIVQTIQMLKTLPLPQNLQRVPDIAGNHHEKINGTGYPRRLNANQLSIPDRIMALVDVFEALTATDRPYKPAHALSKALNIMANMVREQHLDGELFRLFVESGTPQRYAATYLQLSQRDTVDAEQLLKQAGLTQ